MADEKDKTKDESFDDNDDQGNEPDAPTTQNDPQPPDPGDVPSPGKGPGG